MKAKASTKMAIVKDGGVNMKNKTFLLILPALMALSSCTYLSSGVAQPKGNLFKEDASAHSEVFDEESEAFEFRKQPFMKSSLDDFVEPKIGVQYGAKYNISETETPEWCFAIRFVAAVGSLDVDATWTRTIYKDDGTKLGTTENRPTTQAYAVLNGGDGVGTIRADEEVMDNTDDFVPYNYYVAYTIYDIPYDSFNDYYATAYLTLTDPYGSYEPVSSKMMVARLGGGAKAKFDKDKTGFFLAGILDGKVGNTANPNGDIKGGNAAAFAEYLAVGDRVMVVQIQDGKLKVWNGDNLQSGNADAADVDNMIEINTASRYALFLNTDNEIWHTGYATTYCTYYVRGPAASGSWDELVDNTYRLHTDPTNTGYIRITLTEGAFKLTTKDSWDGAMGFDALQGGNAKGTKITGDGDGNMVCNQAGTYDIYYKAWWEIYIDFVR